MTKVKSKLLVDSQNSFLVYHFKSLNLVQNSAMNETFNTIAGHKIRKKQVSINRKKTQSLLQFNPRHREEED